MKDHPILIKKAKERKDYPEHQLMEVALVGRSNVGKSSLINTLIKKKGFAAISSTPGKTRSINFYQLNQKVALVDLPGYGYAKVSQEMKRSWATMIQEYLYKGESLVAIIQIVDARHSPSKDDMTMGEWLKDRELPLLLVATKVDKIKGGKRKGQRDLIKETLNYHQSVPFLFFSAITGEGREEVMKFISTLKGL